MGKICWAAEVSKFQSKDTRQQETYQADEI